MTGWWLLPPAGVAAERCCTRRCHWGRGVRGVAVASIPAVAVVRLITRAVVERPEGVGGRTTRRSDLQQAEEALGG